MINEQIKKPQDLNLILEINEELNLLNSKMNWDNDLHRFQATFKHNTVCVYDTSKYATEYRIQGKHIFIGNVGYDECIEYLRIASLILSINDLYCTNFYMTWNLESSLMELYSFDRCITTGDYNEIQKVLDYSNLQQIIL